MKKLTNKINIEYDEITSINKELYIVKNNGKYGIIDKNGNLALGYRVINNKIVFVKL